MAFTLGFHILLVPFGVAFTLLMMIANWCGLRRNEPESLLLARRWSKVAAVLFAVGAVSGTVLSFELGLLWPGLMGRFGAAYGIPFAVEGIFFFLEAIFIAVYIYGWDRVRPWPHFWSGAPVVVAGAGGTAAVVAANSWMNLPGGVTVRDGRVVSVRPLAVLFSRPFWYENLHMFLAAYIVAGFAVAAVYAVGMLRGRTDRYHRLGFLVGFVVAAVVTPAQLIVGDAIARQVYQNEPSKFAAIEILPRTSRRVPETLGGILTNGRVRYGIRIPDLASLLAGGSTNTKVNGLDEVGPRPPDHLATVVHLAFDVMVSIGFLLLALSAWFAVSWWRKRDLPTSRWFLRGTAASGALAAISLEAGWIVTEVGRQPWTVRGLMFTRDAVTRSGNVWWFFAVTLVIYAVVGWATIRVLSAMRRHWQARGVDLQVPYGPDETLEHAIPPVPVGGRDQP
jgi:cytochrome d ubiquinol oxidase subunit I